MFGFCSISHISEVYKQSGVYKQCHMITIIHFTNLRLQGSTLQVKLADSVCERVTLSDSKQSKPVPTRVGESHSLCRY